MAYTDVRVVGARARRVESWRGLTRRGWARPCAARRGAARPGKAWVSHPTGRLPGSSPGRAREVGQGTGSAGPGIARLVAARRRKAGLWHGEARKGTRLAGIGVRAPDAHAWQGVSMPGPSPRGTARQGATNEEVLRPMAFSVDDAWDNCTPVARAGNAAFGVYCRCGAWSARNSSDGYIPAEVALSIGSPELASKLVSVGLWEAAEGGWSMPHYLERNESAEQVRARRVAESERKARWREKQKVSTRDTTRTGRGRHAGRDAEKTSPFTPPKGGRGGRVVDSLPAAHLFEDDGSGGCSKCVLPRINKIHNRKSA